MIHVEPRYVHVDCRIKALIKGTALTVNTQYEYPRLSVTLQLESSWMLNNYGKISQTKVSKVYLHHPWALSQSLVCILWIEMYKNKGKWRAHFCLLKSCWDLSMFSFRRVLEYTGYNQHFWQYPLSRTSICKQSRVITLMSSGYGTDNEGR